MIGVSGTAVPLLIRASSAPWPTSHDGTGMVQCANSNGDVDEGRRRESERQRAMVSSH